MEKSKLVKANEKNAGEAAAGCRKLEAGVVNGCSKLEAGAVGGFNKIADKFVNNFLTKEGESIEEGEHHV